MDQKLILRHVDGHCAWGQRNGVGEESLSEGVSDGVGDLDQPGLDRGSETP